MSSDHADRHAREDHRNEHAAAVRTERMRLHEAEVRRTLHDRWWRRVQPLMPIPEPVEDPEFPGCVW